MANFFDDIKSFIEGQGYGPVFCEFLPASPDHVIAVFVYGNLPSKDGTLTRLTQIQVRHESAPDAYRIATELSHMLDSGSEEQLINLTQERWCHCTPRKRPRSFGHDDKGRTTYYFEVSIWGPDGL
ncbi:MAG TPA: minor capsid protein [Bacillota bacterium]|nr:minor capsid protein [Bacillota bacterium]